MVKTKKKTKSKKKRREKQWGKIEKKKEKSRKTKWVLNYLKRKMPSIEGIFCLWRRRRDSNPR